MNTKALPKVSSDQTNQQFKNVIQQIIHTDNTLTVS